MTTDWFTADLHLYHNNIMKHCRRPFPTVEEHDEVIIENINNVVKPSDNLFMLGDLAFKNAEELLCRINGNKIIVLGNHDNAKVLQKYRVEAKIQQIKDIHWFKRKDIHIWLSHYPHRSWKNCFHGSWHLYGHTHGSVEDYGFSTDIGVDCWNYKPVCLDQVIDYMNYKRDVENVKAPKENKQ